MPTSSLKCFCLALEKRKQLLSVSLISSATICTNLNSYSRDLQKNFNLGNNKSVNLELTESKNKELSKVIHWRAELADPCCQSITVKSFTEKPDREKKTTNEGKKKSCSHTIRSTQCKRKRQRSVCVYQAYCWAVALPPDSINKFSP